MARINRRSYYSGYSLLGFSDDKQKSENETFWKSILQDYGYLLTDDFDLVIAEAVKTGYFKEEDLKKEAIKKIMKLLLHSL